MNPNLLILIAVLTIGIAIAIIIIYVRWHLSRLAEESENLVLYAGLILSAASLVFLLYYLAT